MGPPLPTPPAAVMTTTTTTNPLHMETLHDLLVRDVDHSGQRLLLPYLSTTDLLHLSECSKALLRYRTFLTHIKLLPLPYLAQSKLAPLQPSSLHQLLSEQNLGISHLTLGHRSLLSSALKDLEGSHGIKALKALDLSKLRLRDDDVEVVVEAMKRGSLRGLEVLDLSEDGSYYYKRSRFSAWMMSSLLSVLADGHCPLLRGLNLSHQRMDSHLAQGIAMVLSKGHCPDLRELVLSGNELEAHGVSVIARALKGVPGGSCLQTLSLSRCDISVEDGHELGLAFTSGGCPHLRSLTICSYQRMDQDTIIPILKALDSGSCPHLEHLDITNVALGVQGGDALANAISTLGGQHLHSLRLRSIRCLLAPTEEEPLLAAFNIIKMGGCPHLQHLDLSKTDLGYRCGLVLGEALKIGACPDLEELSLAALSTRPDGNDFLPDDHPVVNGIELVMDALGGGTAAGSCPTTSKLQMIDISGAKMGKRGSTGLAKYLSSPHCCDLHHLGLRSACKDLVNSLVIVKALKSQFCRGLKELDLGMDQVGVEHGQVLGEIMGGGGLPHLEELRLNFNEGFKDDGVIPLLEGLGAHPRPTLHRLALYRSGIGPRGVSALVHCLASGSLVGLQQIEADENLFGDDHAAQIMQALAYPSICHISSIFTLEETSQGHHQAVQEILDHLHRGTWPRLESLHLHQKIDDALMDKLASLLEDGAGAYLTSLMLDDISLKSFHRLGQAFFRGACPRLISLTIGGTLSPSQECASENGGEASLPFYEEEGQEPEEGAEEEEDGGGGGEQQLPPPPQQAFDHDYQDGYDEYEDMTRKLQDCLPSRIEVSYLMSV